MATAEDLNRTSAPEKAPSSASPPPPGQSRRSVHGALGGGKVADLLLWKRRSAGILVAVAATSIWFLFEVAGYSFLSFFASAFLLLVTILFFWAKSASLLNRPLPPIPNLEISDEVVGRAADEARVWINRALAVGRDIALGGDRKLFLKVILVLWVVSYIGSFFSFLTLIYIGVLLALTVPALYDKYQDHVDGKLCIAHGLILKQYDNVLNRTVRQSNKEKKTQ